jgi:RHS repeat-associated protein
MWQMSADAVMGGSWLQTKHLFLGETRIAVKSNYEDVRGVDETEGNQGFEGKHQYWYHGDHVGSAQIITDGDGAVYERVEYTPYGEVWIEELEGMGSNTVVPYLFTGKELDRETGYYYYGARYLDPRTSRWISGDPAIGEYIPSAPINDEAKQRNGNLPGMGGVFNLVNMQMYHYAGNNPVKYVDPDGRDDEDVLTPQEYVTNVLLPLYNLYDNFPYTSDDTKALLGAKNDMQKIFGTLFDSPIETLGYSAALGVLGAIGWDIYKNSESVKNLVSDLTQRDYDININNNFQLNVHLDGALTSTSVSATSENKFTINLTDTTNVKVQFGVGVSVPRNPWPNFGKTTFNNGGRDIRVLFSTSF